MNNTNQYELEVIINPRLKHSYISIEVEKKVIVKTPYRSQLLIDKLLDSKAAWINKKLNQIETRTALGNQTLHTLEFLQSRVEFYSDVMSLQYRQLKFRKMRRRWGSCSSEGVITLNKELLKLEQQFVDYIVVHELAHLVHMNHSKQFHDLVDRYLPQSQKLRKELKNIQIIST